MTLDTAMVLAAGFGTRMGSLTRTRPKPLLPVAGRALIDHALDTAEAAGVRRAVVNLHYLGGQIRQHLAARISPAVAFSEELPDILDTGGGVVRALPLLGRDAFFSLNSDAIFVGQNPLDVLAGRWEPARMDALLLLVPVARARAYARAGDFFLEAEASAPRRRGSAPAAPLVFSGAQILSPTAFDGFSARPFSLNQVWDKLLENGGLAGVTYPGAWVDVGTPEGLAEAERALTATDG